MIRRTICAFVVLGAMAAAAWADSGVLIPMDKQEPDPSILSLGEMQVEIRIDNGDARVWMRQVFTNHTAQVQEGNYVFALPSGTTVSDFAVWDGPTRIPAVILERKRAKAIYQELKSQAIDPGLLEQGEQGSEDARRTSLFSAHIVPIPAYGTKRLEIEYHQRIPVEAHKSYFVLPMKPDAYASQQTAKLTIHFELHSAARIKDFAVQGHLLPFHIDKQDEHSIYATVDAAQIDLAEDLAASWTVNEPNTALEVITFRDPNSANDWQGIGVDTAIEKPAVPSGSEPGFFEAVSQLTVPKPNASAATNSAEPGTIVVLMDTSVSMQWEKLERSYAAAAKLLEGLPPQDHFNLLLFNTQVESFRPAPVAADLETVRAAIEWLRMSHLRGGTDLGQAVKAGLGQFANAAPGANALVLLTDGEATRGEIRGARLSSDYTASWKQIPAERRPKTDIFAVGDDANVPLLRDLSRNGGVLEQVLSSEPIDFKLSAFLSKVGATPIAGLDLTATSPAAVEKVYALDDAVFDGGEARWVGQYARPQKGVQFTAEGSKDGHILRASTKVDLPATALEHDQLLSLIHI